MRIYRLASLMLSCILALLLQSCATKSVRVAEEAPARSFEIDIVPAELTVEPGHQRMTVSWKRIGDGLISGYNIYISDEPLTRNSLPLALADSAVPFNSSPYPGDTDPTDGVERFEAEGLVNGRKYYVTIRVIYPDRSLSRPSNEVMAVCGPRGEISLVARFAGENDGLAITTGQFVRADAPENDLYFYSKDGVDYLASPSRLGGYTNQSLFDKLVLKRGGWDSIRRQLGQYRPNATEDKLAIKPGDWILLKRTDNSYAVINIVRFDGAGRDRKVRLFYAYCPLSGELIF